MISAREKCKLNYAKERMWEPGYLKARCAELRLETEFRLYRIRLWKSYLCAFFMLHICVTLVHCTLLLTTIQDRKLIYFDVVLVTGCCVVILAVLSVNFCDDFIAKHTWYMYASSIFASLTLVFTDLTESIYHHYAHNWVLGTFYDTYILYMVYMFLPIHFIKGAVLLALLVSALYILYFINYLAEGFFEFLGELFSISGMSVDIVHYLCLNLVGIFYRVMNDTVVRSSFLDRHQYIKEEIWLRNARLQEKQLLDSILPPQISQLLQRDIKTRLKLARQGGGMHAFSAMERAMAIQMHPEVSILYADVVNYTHLTTTLTVEKLVKVLHDLYGRFDLAAFRYKVQRIKFLGDCYYCVAGLSGPDPDHATKCVSLGLSMINEIQEVRDVQQLDINMRIGVHSGTLFAGVIGEAKLQLDIWGTDVNIANALESSGVSGFVHISADTLNHLERDRYVIENGPESARHNPVLRRRQISTYIVRKEIREDDESSESDKSLLELHSLSHMNLGSKYRVSANTSESLRVVFQDELREQFRKMPVSAFNPKELYYKYRQKHNQNQNPQLNKQLNSCLSFYNHSMEKAYLNQTDYMFKYSMLLVCCLTCCLMYIQLMVSEITGGFCLIFSICVITVMSILTLIAWYKKMCWTRYRESDHKYSLFSCTIFRIHEKIIGSLGIRIVLYLFLVFSSYTIMLLIVMSCERDEFELRNIEEKLFHYDDDSKICFHPWVASNMVSLMICITFTFTRIPFLVKTAIAVLETLGYMVIIFFQFEFVFHSSITTNPNFPAEYAHGLLICITLVTMFVKERQLEFVNKVNFNWRVELKKKENDASLTNQSIIIILNNILPSYIVDVYLNSLAKHELYYENYSMVSVMFAMLMNFETDLRGLRVLNEIIAEFDVLLLFYKEYFSVEKIKIVGCTYMAACGLDLSFAGSTSRPIGSTDTGDADAPKLSIRVHENELEEVVFVMASFARDMMRTLAKSNEIYQSIPSDRTITDGTIAIGISSGEVMAGIVGASQPHYDIWGTPVNMASRMESTGLVGHIQVTEESARILNDFGIYCEYRDMTFVKGRGKIPTFLVKLDEDLNFIYIEQKRTPSHLERSTAISLASTYQDNSVFGDLKSLSNITSRF